MHIATAELLMPTAQSARPAILLAESRIVCYSSHVIETMLLIFAKAPTPGRVKTRLATRIGESAATAAYRRLANQTAAAAATAKVDRVTVYYDPPGNEPETMVRLLLGHEHWLYTPQAQGDLGVRLRQAFAATLTIAQRVVIIGTDCPQLDGALITSAFSALRETPLVLGPACDGGYYLIGLSCLHPELFTDIAWSTSTVLEQTLARASIASITPHILPMLEDVDDEPSYRRWLALDPAAASLLDQQQHAPSLIQHRE
jgi:rSAM/selenodomain-associated transferase 1